MTAEGMTTIGEGLAPPEPPIVVEHRQQLIHLLREASELEHTIMCQYLFAAFTMKRRADEGLTADQVEAVGRWREVVLEVAHQEMLHLALVQNLLTAIGAAPYLARPPMPAPAKHFPPGVQVALMPFGERALRHFLFLERPEGMPLDDAEGFAAVERARPLVDETDIVPRAQDYATVGHLYRAIDIGFAWLTDKLGEDGLFIGPADAQATPELFRWPQLVPVLDLDSAHRAIDTIVEQGEGVTGEWREAHFGRFLRILDEFLVLREVDPSFEPARQVLTGTVRHDADPALPVIEDRASAQVADLFNVVYEITLLSLARLFAHTDETHEDLGTLAHVSVGLMVGGLRPIGELLTTLPFGPAYPGMRAAPTFEVLLRGYLLPHRRVAWFVMEERLRQAADFARLIESTSGIALGQVGASLSKLADRLAAGRAAPARA